MHIKRIKNILLHYKSNPLAIFLLKGFVLFLLWDILIYDFVITPSIHNWVIYRLVDVSGAILHLIYPTVLGVGSELFINGKHCVHIGIPCNGLEVMGVFGCIIIAYNADWYHKLWIIMSGFILIFILNVFRISALAALIVEKHLRAFDINHKYIFNIILYGLLLIVFSLWTSAFGRKINIRPIE